jgi:hypothetical protein
VTFLHPNVLFCPVPSHPPLHKHTICYLPAATHVPRQP